MLEVQKINETKLDDRAERYDFRPQLWLFLSPFLFSHRKIENKKRRMNSKNFFQKSCLSAQSSLIVIAFLKDGFLEILFYDWNQVNDKIVCGLGEGFLCIHSSFVCHANTTPFPSFSMNPLRFVYKEEMLRLKMFFFSILLSLFFDSSFFLYLPLCVCL